MSGLDKASDRASDNAIDKADYAFSTCWNIKRHASGSDMIEEIRSLGFKQVELNCNVTESLLATIEPMIGGIQA